MKVISHRVVDVMSDCHATRAGKHDAGWLSELMLGMIGSAAYSRLQMGVICSEFTLQRVRYSSLKAGL